MDKNIKEGLTPIGVLENGEVFGISEKDRLGTLCLFGKRGQGKSVALENIIISDIYNKRNGIFIDPYGDLIENIKSYIPAEKQNDVVVFEASGNNLEKNIENFKKEIDFVSMQNNGPRYFLFKLDYPTLGINLAHEFGIYIIKQFLKDIGENYSMVLDESHNFIDEEILEEIIKNENKKLFCIFSDQTSLDYRVDILKKILSSLNHLVSYCVDQPTAKIVSKYHSEMMLDQLTNLEKYHFFAKLNVKSDSPFISKAKGVFPIPFKKIYE